MGTRNLTCVVKGGEYKIAQYGQWDGYPTGAGKKILNFLKNANLEIFSEKVSQLRFVTAEEAERFNKDIEEYLKNMSTQEWQSLQSEERERNMHPTTELTDKYLARPFIQFHRDLGWEILDFIMRGNTPPLKNEIEFAGDSLFCQWAYVIDLDKNTFEIYEGLNQVPVPAGQRFCNFKAEGDYFPVKHRVTFDIGQLPTKEEFLAQLSS